MNGAIDFGLNCTSSGDGLCSNIGLKEEWTVLLYIRTKSKVFTCQWSHVKWKSKTRAKFANVDSKVIIIDKIEDYKE